jgi:hypothetical protein
LTREVFAKQKLLFRWKKYQKKFKINSRTPINEADVYKWGLGEPAGYAPYTLKDPGRLIFGKLEAYIGLHKCVIRLPGNQD